MKTTPPRIPRQKLLAILKHHDIAPAAFDALRADAYEKHIATHSLEALEHLYALVLDPALSYTQMQPLCPPWPTGRHAGHPPSLQTLSDIKHRIMAKQTVNDLGRMEELLKTLRHRSTALSDKLQTEMFNVIVTMLGQELFVAKLDGKPIIENLRAVDRLIKVAALRVRQQEGEVRLKLLERREDRADRRPASSQPDAVLQPEKSAVAANASGNQSGLTESEKTDRMIERIYGLRPDGTSTRPIEKPSCPIPEMQTDPTAQDPQKSSAIAIGHY